MKLIIFGGGGACARHVARLAQGLHDVVSVVRNDNHSTDLKRLGAQPHILSLEDASSGDIASFLTASKADAVLFAAGAGGKQGPERTRAVDYHGALKVYQACHDAKVPRIVIISAVDVRDVSKPPPKWYNAESITTSERMWTSIGQYMQAKYDAEKVLHDKFGTLLDFTVIRPGRLTDDPAGGAEAGRTQLTPTSRELVAKAVLAALANTGTIGLTLDVVDGKGDLKAEIEKCAKDKVDAWTG